MGGAAHDLQAHMINPEYVALEASHGFESAGMKQFMRG
jgi:hypothetical protein